MPDVVSRREGKPTHARGERVMPGLFRLRLPLPWPGVPHCNAWAVTSGDGFVLFDTGMHQPDSISHLERALEMCNLRLEDARLVVCTHAHTDHCGQAPTVVERAGCEVWMHPNHEHLNRMIEDPDAVFARRLEVARQSGVPEEPLRRYAAERTNRGSGIAGPIEPNRSLLAGVTIGSDLGEWVAYETPGHAPSHVCLFQPERRLLISGDHLLGRISLYFDYGYSTTATRPTPSANSSAPWTSWRDSVRAFAWPGTAAPSPTYTPTSAATARSWTNVCSGCAARSTGAS